MSVTVRQIAAAQGFQALALRDYPGSQTDGALMALAAAQLLGVEEEELMATFTLSKQLQLDAQNRVGLQSLDMATANILAERKNYTVMMNEIAWDVADDSVDLARDMAEYLELESPREPGQAQHPSFLPPLLVEQQARFRRLGLPPHELCSSQDSVLPRHLPPVPAVDGISPDVFRVSKGVDPIEELLWSAPQLPTGAASVFTAPAPPPRPESPHVEVEECVEAPVQVIPPTDDPTFQAVLESQLAEQYIQLGLPLDSYEAALLPGGEALAKDMPRPPYIGEDGKPLASVQLFSQSRPGPGAIDAASNQTVLQGYHLMWAGEPEERSITQDDDDMSSLPSLMSLPEQLPERQATPTPESENIEPQAVEQDSDSEFSLSGS